MGNKYKETNFEIWWRESQAWKFCLGFIIGMLFIGIAVISNNFEKEEDCSYSFFVGDFQEGDYTHVVVNKNGLYLDGVLQDSEYAIWNKTSESIGKEKNG